MNSLVMVVKGALPHTDKGTQLTMVLLTFMLNLDVISEALFSLADIFALVAGKAAVAVLDVHVLVQGYLVPHIVTPWFWAGVFVLGVQGFHVFVEGGLGGSPETTVVANKLLHSLMDEPNVLINVMFTRSTVPALLTLEPFFLVLCFHMRRE